MAIEKRDFANPLDPMSEEDWQTEVELCLDAETFDAFASACAKEQSTALPAALEAAIHRRRQRICLGQLISPNT